MRFLFLLFAVCAFAAPKHAPKHFSDDQPQKEKGIYLDESEIEEARMLIKLTDTILHGSDLTRDGNLEQAAKKAEAASKIAAKLVKLRKPGVTREDADALKQAAEEAEKAAAADDEKGVQEAISAMEYQLEKILENLEDMIKMKEEELGFSKHTATEQADVPLTADSEAMTDLEAAANQTVHGDTMIPHEHKEKAINYTTKSAKEGFHQANTTNGKLKKLSENEENWEEERPHHHRYHLYGSEHNKTCKSRRFNWHRCKHHFGHRFCRRMFFRRFLHHRGFHHFFHHRHEDQDQQFSHHGQDQDQQFSHHGQDQDQQFSNYGQDQDQQFSNYGQDQDQQFSHHGQEQDQQFSHHRHEDQDQQFSHDGQDQDQQFSHHGQDQDQQFSHHHHHHQDQDQDW